MTEKLTNINNLNCHDAHVAIMKTGDELHYGYALGSYEQRYQHCWLIRDNKLLDLFNWTDHEDFGIRLKKN